MPNDVIFGPIETMTKAEAARAALASPRLAGLSVDARSAEILLAWGAGLLSDTALADRVEELERQYLNHSA